MLTLFGVQVVLQEQSGPYHLAVGLFDFSFWLQPGSQPSVFINVPTSTNSPSSVDIAHIYFMQPFPFLGLSV